MSRTWRQTAFWVIGVSTAAWLASCTEGSKGQEVDFLEAIQGTVPYAVITLPTGLRVYTTAENRVTLGGPGFADTVVWSTDRGESGTTMAVGEWSADVPLHLGDNFITVTASSEGTVGTEDTITITHNPYLSFDGPVVISPSEGFVNEQVEAIVRVSIIVNDDLVTSSVRVAAVDENNVVLGDLFSLADDGNSATGDELAGDGVYSGICAFNEPSQTEIRLRVLAETGDASATNTAQSEVFTFTVIEPLTQENADRMEAVGGEAETIYDTILASADHVEAAAQTVAFLLSQADVLQAGSTDDGHSVWWELEVGPGRTVEQGMGMGIPGTNSAPTLDKTNASILEPYYNEWLQSNNQVGDHLEALFTDTWCPKLHPVNFRRGNLATVEEFKELYKYGLISINSHGALWGKETKASAVIWTEEIAFPHDYIAGSGGKYAADVAERRLQTWISKGVWYYVVTGKFFYKYANNNLQGAVVFNSACHGMSDEANREASGPLYWAFIKNGAKVYLGGTGRVTNKWGGNWNKGFFDALILGNNIEESWKITRAKYGEEDPDRPGTRLRMRVFRNEDRKLMVATECDGYMTITHEYFTAQGNTIAEEKATLLTTGTLVQAPWMEGVYALTKEEGACSYRREVFVLGQKTSDESGSGQLTEYYGDPEGSIDVYNDRFKLCIDHENQKIFVYPIERFSEQDWVTYDLTTYPVDIIPGGHETSCSNCKIPSVLFAVSQSQGTGVCGLIGGAMLEFDVPANGQIGADFVQGSKIFETSVGKATVEFAYRLRE